MYFNVYKPCISMYIFKYWNNNDKHKILHVRSDFDLSREKEFQTIDNI